MDSLLTLDAIPKRDPKTGAVLWYTNPGKGKKGKGQPPALKRYWAAVRAAAKGGKKNPFEQLHYPRRSHATVAYRDSKTGKWTMTAGKGGKPAAARNPAEMAVLNPGAMTVVHKIIRAGGKKPGHNPPRASGSPGTVGGFFKGLFTFRAAAKVATAVAGAVVDRQLVPRAVEMLPAWLDRIKTGPFYMVTRGVFAAGPALLALIFKARRFLPWALTYGFGAALSIGVSLIESLLNRKLGLPTLGELGGETLEASGDPEGLFAGYRGDPGLMGYRGHLNEAGDQMGGYRGMNEMDDADLADMEPAY